MLMYDVIWVVDSSISITIIEVSEKFEHFIIFVVIVIGVLQCFEFFDAVTVYLDNTKGIWSIKIWFSHPSDFSTGTWPNLE